MIAPAWTEPLRNARVPWVRGMDTSTGEGIVVIVWDDGSSFVHDSESYECDFVCPQDDAVPNPEDPATRYLLLAELARRVGLDPTWGVTWHRAESGHWWIATVEGGEERDRSWRIDTDDPTLALCEALAQTAPKETT